MFSFTEVALAKNIALIVGVSSYQADEGIEFGDPLYLEGPLNDVAALRKVLINHWGFKQNNIRVLTDRQASRDAILGEVDALYERSVAGDEVFVYYSGHGTSRFDPKTKLPLPHTSGAIVPWDAKINGSRTDFIASLIVGRRDLVPRFKKLDQGGRNLTVFFDSCYSGNSVRSVPCDAVSGCKAQSFRNMDKVIPDSIKAAWEDDEDDFLFMQHGKGTRDLIEPWPYERVFYLSASSESQEAVDIRRQDLRRSPTLDGKPHGAFTDVLLRVLSGNVKADFNNDKSLSHEELKQAIQLKLKSNKFYQQPQTLPRGYEDTGRLLTKPLFRSPFNIDAPEVTQNLRVSLEGLAQVLTSNLSHSTALDLVSSNADIIVRRTPEGFQFYDGLGYEVSRIDGLHSENKAIARLHQLAWFHQLSWRSRMSNPYRFRLDLNGHTNRTRFVAGEQIAFNIESSKPVWLIILYVDSNGEPGVLYPVTVQETRQLAANTVHYIPEKSSVPLAVTAPFGTDMVVAIALTEKPVFLNQLMRNRSLNPAGQLYKDLLQVMQSNGAAVATLELQTQRK